MYIKNLFIFCLVFVSCEPKPEFFIDGKPYYTIERCVKSHVEDDYGYHYGYNILTQRFEYHFGYYSTTVCDETKIDTIEIKR